MIDKIKEIQSKVDKIEALIRPKVKIAKEADELIRREEERRAHTGKYETPRMYVNVFTKDKTIAEIEISAKTISRVAWDEIKKQREQVKIDKEKLSKIREIIDSDA